MANAIKAVSYTHLENEKRTLHFQVTTGYRDASNGLDIEDVLIKEEKLEIQESSINLQYYKIEDGASERINAMFEYQDMQYLLSTNDIKEEEFKKILKNLKIF